MKRSVLIVIAILLLCTCKVAFAHLSFHTCSDNHPERVREQYKGWPQHDAHLDVRQGFAQPPRGYGNVPFYWWSGDSLSLARLQAQLDLLADASTDGLCVSYCHTHADVDTLLNAAGHGYCGRVQGGAPRVFSAPWYDIWRKFSAQCADRGIGLGMDDYVVGWPGNGEYVDSVRALTGIADYKGKLVMQTLGRGDTRPQDVVLDVAKEGTDSSYVISAKPSPELSPLLGQKMVAYYLQPFVAHTDTDGQRGMNYFFQDELIYDLTLQSWAEDMPTQFLRRKGYDILPHLPSLFIDYNQDDYKTRLDYAEVVTQLAEERFFSPIYDWFNQRGLIYGSDNMGRGTNPTQYLDYFRAEKWYTAPGNDAPARGSSFNQTKVSSSVAHLYGRPRTWLEAFHSMGWDANGAVLTHQLDHHIIAGGNLLCMHGLYYSTHGGWWEWAPPCFHFRMPYWPHTKRWLRYAERLCYLLSQGTHVADVAVLYPTETMQAVRGSSPALTFAVTDSLSRHGIDFDYIDYASLQGATYGAGGLHIGAEDYPTLLLAEAKALHAETLNKVEAYARSGGRVVIVGDVMTALRDKPYYCYAASAAEALQLLQHLPERDFTPQGTTARVLHRRIAGQKPVEVYMVMDAQRDTPLHFRAKGRLEVWNAWDGTMHEITPSAVDASGTWVKHQADATASCLYVFTPSESPSLHGTDTRAATTAADTMAVTGTWQMTVVPTLDNRWGDYRLPASNGLIGVEAREVSCRYFPSRRAAMAHLREFPVAGDSTNIAIYGYGAHLMTKTFAPHLDLDSLESVLTTRPSITDDTWLPYTYSWQYGVFDQPGGQGWHGLKAKVDGRFLILDRGGHQCFYTKVYAPSDATYRIIVEGVKPHGLYIDNKPSHSTAIALTKGWHTLLMTYADTPREDFVLSAHRGSFEDKRLRSMVVLMPEGSPEPHDTDPYAPIVASKWYNANHLPYDCYGGERGCWLLTFETAPGTQSLDLQVQGRVRGLWLDGKPVTHALRGGSHITLDAPTSGVSVGSLLVEPDAGFGGAACLLSPIALTTTAVSMPLGDWSECGALRYYSGGMIYAKDIDLPAAKGQRFTLDLGEVDATCEVRINGRAPRVLVAHPYTTDITEDIVAGRNHIEILVYSSLSNHYQSIPSPYKGKPHAGLIGPVRMVISKDGGGQ